MKFAVSNIAWAPADRAVAYGALKAAGISGLEIAPGLFFAGAADPFSPTEAEAAPRLAEIENAGLTLVSMQSLLYSVSGAAVFEGPKALERLKAGMGRAIDLAGRFGIPNLVFGSPRQRIVPEGVEMCDAMELALEVFRDLGNQAVAAGTVIAMEFNPPAYGTNFLNDVDQALSFVKAAAHPGVKLILDLGAMHINGDFDQIEAVVAEAAPYLSHVHVSEPDLAPAPAEVGQARRVLGALAAVRYHGWVSIEMKAAEDDAVAEMAAAVARLNAAATAGMVAP